MSKHIRLLFSQETKSLEIFTAPEQEEGYLIEDIASITIVDLSFKNPSYRLDYND
jgi:hypothetical protein